MKTVKLNIFEIFSLSWISFSLVALFLVLLNLFLPAILVSTILAISYIIYYLRKKKIIEINNLDKNFWIAFGFVCIFAIFLSIFTTPTIFGGRDEGSYATSAIMMAEKNDTVYSSELIDQFYGIYGPGKALNFPGFYYTDDGLLKSQFLPAYPSWIAVWYKFFGLSGIKFTNLFPFITFLLSFYLLIGEIAKESNFFFANKKTGNKILAVGLLMLATTFPVVIFYKFTLGEIYFASLLWFSIYLFSRYSQNKSALRYWLIFLPLAILPFARIEAMILIFMFLFSLIFKDFNHLRLPRYQLPFVLLGILFIIIFAFEPDFFINSVKNIAEPLMSSTDPNGGDRPSFLPDDWQGLYTLKLFYTYNIFSIFILGSAFLLNLLRKNQRGLVKNKSFLIPFVLLSPTLLYLFDANISLDHPWYFRRLIFAVIPVFILYTTFLLGQIKQAFHFLFWPIVILILISNLFLFFSFKKNGDFDQSFLLFAQNQKLLSQATDISKELHPNDLILISQQSSGSGWSLLSEPLREILGKNAVYFFNPNDLDKIDKSKFENIYLLSSQDELGLYENIEKQELKNYSLENAIVAPSRDPNQRPTVLQTITSTTLFQIAK